jgi:hypothetical protein
MDSAEASGPEFGTRTPKVTFELLNTEPFSFVSTSSDLEEFFTTKGTKTTKIDDPKIPNFVLFVSFVVSLMVFLCRLLD